MISPRLAEQQLAWFIYGGETRGLTAEEIWNQVHPDTQKDIAELVEKIEARKRRNREIRQSRPIT